MSWRENLEKLIRKALFAEPCLEVPVIEQNIGMDMQIDMLDKLIYDALEDDFLPLPIISDPKIVQWIDWVEELEEKQLKSVSDANVQQDPETEEEKPVQANKVYKGQQSQLQPKKCDTCNEEFDYPVNARRHKWKHRNVTQEKIMEADRDRFRGYWEKLDDERAYKIMSVKDSVLPDGLQKLQVNDIIEAVSSYIEALDEESRCQKHKSLPYFLLKLEGGDERPAFQEIPPILLSLSEGNFFRGTLDPEMQKIVFPHGITEAEIKEQGLLASFGFLVESLMMKTWADDRKHNGELLEKEEEETNNQLKATSKGTKPSASKRKKEKSKLSEKHTENNSSKDKKGHDSSDAGTSSQLMNPRESKESTENMTDKGSLKRHKGQDSSNADAAQLKPVTSVDSVQDSFDADTSQLNPRESQEIEKNMTDKGSPKSHKGQGSSNVDAAQLNPVTSVVKDNMFSLPTEKTKGMKWGDYDMDDYGDDFTEFGDGGSLMTCPQDKLLGQGEWKTWRSTKARHTSKQPQYGTNMHATHGSQGQGSYPRFGRGGRQFGGRQTFTRGGRINKWNEKPSTSTLQTGGKNKNLKPGVHREPIPSKNLKPSERESSSYKTRDWLNKNKGQAGAKNKVQAGMKDSTVAGTPDGPEKAQVPSGQTSEKTDIPVNTPAGAKEQTSEDSETPKAQVTSVQTPAEMEHLTEAEKPAEMEDLIEAEKPVEMEDLTEDSETPAEMEDLTEAEKSDGPSKAQVTSSQNPERTQIPVNTQAGAKDQTSEDSETPAEIKDLTVVEKPVEPKKAQVTSGQNPCQSQNNDSDRMISSYVRKSQIIFYSYDFDSAFSDYLRYLRQIWDASFASPDCIELEEYWNREDIIL